MGVFSCFYMKMWPTYKTKDTLYKGQEDGGVIPSNANVYT